MESKGLFELIFMLIMLVLLLPATNQSTHIVTSSVQTQLNSFALLSDSAIADALSDATYTNCSLETKQNYINLIVVYLSNLKTEFNLNGNNCEYNFPSFITTYSSRGFEGEIDISCFSENSRTSTYLKKKLFFDKQILVVNSMDGYCKVTIEDNYTTGYNPVDYNLSYP